MSRKKKIGYGLFTFWYALAWINAYVGGWVGWIMVGVYMVCCWYALFLVESAKRDEYLASLTVEDELEMIR